MKSIMTVSIYHLNDYMKLIDKTYNELNCDAIPEMSLNNNYVNNWNTWNGNELDDQIVDGVNSLMEQCYRKGNESQKKYLKNNDKLEIVHFIGGG